MSEPDRITKHIGGLLFLPFDLIRSGIKPRKGEPKAWYDRAIRVAGGLLCGALVAGMLVEIWRRAR